MATVAGDVRTPSTSHSHRPTKRQKADYEREHRAFVRDMQVKATFIGLYIVVGLISIWRVENHLFAFKLLSAGLAFLFVAFWISVSRNHKERIGESVPPEDDPLGLDKQQNRHPQ